MTYDLPKGVTYSEMCIYIDTHVYTEDCDFELVYQYLYHIFLMLARKVRMFQRFCYYDGFAIFSATKTYFRLINPKQYVILEDGTPKMKKIKSILNYAKKVLYPFKVDYEQTEYCQDLTQNDVSDFVENSNAVRDNIDSLYLVEFDAVLGDIIYTCKYFLKKSPYKTDSKEWMNIYASVILSLLNEITLSSKNTERIEHLEGTNRLTDEHLNNCFSEEQHDSIILFHVDETMKDYVTLLIRKIKHIIKTDLFTIIDKSYCRPRRVI